jgi:CO/xanthine dehydrogenase Mo-binding subunit
MDVVGRRVPRIDAKEKVTGRLVYPSDRHLDSMLYVEVVRAEHPHARILSVDTEEASAFPGVVKVLTAKDVPGENAFGIQIQDMPVLCFDCVRYMGDAVALVGAQTRHSAREGAKRVHVKYEVLPVLTDPEIAMKPESIALHPKGNVLHEGHFQKGEPKEGFNKSKVVIENTYTVPMIDHAFLETEAGVSYYDDQGKLTVESCGQYIFRDQTQIARALGLPLSDVRVVSSYVGGAFGGKDEITVQIHLALMTYHTRRPAKIVATREESIVSHTKRHPVKMIYKTGASGNGKLLAVQAKFISDTGAYASLGGPVLNVMMEHATGPYLVPNVKIDGFAVYTNNGFSGAFRGFGCTQACVGLESQMDLMAKALHMDPLVFREKNVFRKGELAGLGYRLLTEVGAKPTLQAARKGKLYRNRRQLKKSDRKHSPSVLPFIRRGVGVATQMQGLGLGIGIPDYAEVGLDMDWTGRLTLRVGTTELGQGAYTGYSQILAERLSTSMDRIQVVGGDTACTPDSGTTTASRTTFAVGRAVMLAAEKLEKKLGEIASLKLNWPAGAAVLKGECIVGTGGKAPLSEVVGSEGISMRATFHLPVADVELGDGLPHRFYSYGTHVAQVSVNTLTGEVAVEGVEAFLDGGTVISRTGFEGQSEGGVAQGIGYALFEEVVQKEGRFLTTNFNTYLLPTSLDVPERIHTVPVEVREKDGPFGAKGISETAMVGVTPAILNALADALSVRFYRLPVRAEDVLRALEKK